MLKMKMRCAWVLMAVAATIFWAANRDLMGQSGSGVVRGVVRDANQAVVPGATVTVTNERTGVPRKTQTNAEGIYYVGALPLGQYQVVVEVTGFKKWSTKLALEVGQIAVVDVSLELGSVETTVDVVGAAAPINTESIDVSDVKDFQRIRQLPLNGRSISNLFNLTPGVEGGGSARVNGLKVGSLEITLDGISLVDRFGGGISRVQPGLDTVEEFRIETVGSDARYSRPATVTLATRSGTNEVHGSIFETHRNNGWNLVSRARQDGSAKAPQLIRNEYGVSAGGPFYLGNLYDGRNKTFWFAAFEGLRQRQGRRAGCCFGPYGVPTEAMWNGDLSGFVDRDGVQTVIYDPLTTDANGVRQPFPNNRIPADRISPLAKRLQALTAKPTNGENPFVNPFNLDLTYPDKRDLGNLTIKGDQQLSDKDRLSVRWTRSTQKFATEGAVFGNPSPGSGLGTSRSDAEINNVTVNHTRTFSPTLLNELMIGVHRSYKSSGTLADFTDYPKELGLPNPFGVTGWPSLYASGAGDPYYWAYWDADNRKDEALTGVVAENNLTWIKGKHTLQFGGKFRPEYNNVRELQQAHGSHGFGGSWTALYDPVGEQAVSFTGHGFADLLLGLPDYLSVQYNRGFFYFRQKEIGLYANDSWKISPRLTLNLGLRWDKWTPYSEQFNRLAAIDLDTVGSVFQVITPGSHDIRSLRDIPPSVLDSWAVRGLTYTTANAVGYPENLFSADNNNFGPRIGAAFRISDNMVLRGGYGEYFWTMPLSQILQTSRTQPPLNLRFENIVSLYDDSGTYSLRTRPTSDFFAPNIGVDTRGIVSLPSSARPGFAWDGRNWKDGRSQSWHFTWERELMKSTALRLSYIGNHGRDLEQRVSINSLEPQFNFITRTGLAPASGTAGDIQRRPNPNWNLGNGYITRSGYSNTHSAQIEIERKYSNGIGFQWFYTFTRSLTTTDAGGFTSGNQGINDGGGGARVPENIELWGAPNLSFEERLRFTYFNSTNVPAHRIRYNGIFDLPFGHGKKYGSGVPGALNHLIGGWQVATIGDWRGGNWLSASAGRYVFGDPTLSAGQRPEMNIFGLRQRLWFRGDVDLSSATNVTGGDPTALVPVDRSQRLVRPLGPNFDNRLPLRLADGTIRNTSITDLYNPSSRAFIIGPGAWNVDLALYKNFTFGERYKAQFSANFFNFFNHPNDLDPNNVTGLQNLARQSNDPRIIQFSLRFDF
ncbi:MAG: TonB-dependent receptor [Acidobacteriota bacterium]